MMRHPGTRHALTEYAPSRGNIWRFLTGVRIGANANIEMTAPASLTSDSDESVTIHADSGVAAIGNVNDENHSPSPKGSRREEK